MKNLKVVKIDGDELLFENGVKLFSNHDQDCCENHYLDFSDLTMQDFEELQFDLTNDNFFKRIEDYGIELVPVKGHSVKVPGYGENNGYYSSDMQLILTDNKQFRKEFDISECQDYEPY